jgi:hypothetical protein
MGEGAKLKEDFFSCGLGFEWSKTAGLGLSNFPTQPQHTEGNLAMVKKCQFHYF